MTKRTRLVNTVDEGYSELQTTTLEDKELDV
jgi:hypothetical protein